MAEIRLTVAAQRINAGLLAPVTYNKVRLAVLAGHLRATLRGGFWWMPEDEIWRAVQYFAQATATRRKA